MTGIKINKTADKKTYMREYMRKQYASKCEDVKERNRAYYANRKYGSEEDLKKYEKKVLPIMVRIKKELVKLNAIRPELVLEVIKLVEEYEAEVAEVEEVEEIEIQEIKELIKENNPIFSFNSIQVASDPGEVKVF